MVHSAASSRPSSLNTCTMYGRMLAIPANCCIRKYGITSKSGRRVGGRSISLHLSKLQCDVPLSTLSENHKLCFRSKRINHPPPPAMGSTFVASPAHRIAMGPSQSPVRFMAQSPVGFMVQSVSFSQACCKSFHSFMGLFRQHNHFATLYVLYQPSHNKT